MDVAEIEADFRSVAKRAGIKQADIDTLVASEKRRLLGQ